MAPKCGKTFGGVWIWWALTAALGFHLGSGLLLQLLQSAGLGWHPGELCSLDGWFVPTSSTGSAWTCLRFPLYLCGAAYHYLGSLKHSGLFPTCLCMPGLFLDRRKWNNSWCNGRDSIRSSAFLPLAVSFCQMSSWFTHIQLAVSLLCFPLLCFHVWDCFISRISFSPLPCTRLLFFLGEVLQGKKEKKKINPFKLHGRTYYSICIPKLDVLEGIGWLHHVWCRKGICH